MAPDFSTRNSHGQTVTLSELRGAPVLLVFYPFAFTGICTGELTGIQQQLPQLRASGARVLAISTDTMFALRVFGEQEQLDLELLSDHWPHGAIASSYGVFDPEVGCALRGTFVLDADGVVTWRVVNQIGEARDVAAHLTALSSA
ncbi:MAG TPA: peroxiredoxin [Propionibacteriaceae bacterium]